MAVGSIYDDYYYRLANITAGTTTKVTDATKAESGTTDTTQVDKLDLNSSLNDMSAYLNYNASGRYSSPSLVDFLNAEDEDGDEGLSGLFDIDSSSDYTGDASSIYQFDSDSLSGSFEELADAKTREIDDLISKVLGKSSSAVDGSTDSEE